MEKTFEVDLGKRSDILVVSPFTIEFPLVISGNKIYKNINIHCGINAMGTIKYYSPLAIVINAFMDKRLDSIHRAINLASEIRKEEFDYLLIATATVETPTCQQHRLLQEGFDKYVPAEELGEKLPGIIKEYLEEKIGIKKLKK